MTICILSLKVYDTTCKPETGATNVNL